MLSPVFVLARIAGATHRSDTWCVCSQTLLDIAAACVALGVTASHGRAEDRVAAGQGCRLCAPFRRQRAGIAALDGHPFMDMAPAQVHERWPDTQAQRGSVSDSFSPSGGAVANRPHCDVLAHDSRNEQIDFPDLVDHGGNDSSATDRQRRRQAQTNSGPPMVAVTDGPGATISDHRSTQGRVPNKAHADNLDSFRPSDAIESLHAAILRVETIAQVASDTVDRLRCPSAPAARRAFARMQILIGKTVDEASTALAEGDKLVAALSQHMQGRTDPQVQRTRQERDG